MRTSQSFSFYPTDFLIGTMFMEAEEVGAYIRLLCYQWQEGFVPDSDENLKKICGISPKRLARVLEKFEKCADGKLRNSRLEEVRENREQFIEAQRLKGKKGGRPPKSRGFSGEKPGVSSGLSRTKAEQNPEESLPVPVPTPSTPVRPKPGATTSGKLAAEIVELYPANGNRFAAASALLLAEQEGDDLTLIRERVKLHAAALEALPESERRFCPGLASYFNDRRWKDDPTKHPWTLVEQRREKKLTEMTPAELARHAQSLL